MASINRTAYPRLKQKLSEAELETQYAPTDDEVRLVHCTTKGKSPHLTFLTMLKARQNLGYFTALHQIPDSIVRYLAETLNLPPHTPLLSAEIKKKSIFSKFQGKFAAKCSTALERRKFYF